MTNRYQLLFCNGIKRTIESELTHFIINEGQHVYASKCYLFICHVITSRLLTGQPVVTLDSVLSCSWNEFCSAASQGVYFDFNRQFPAKSRQ